MKYFNLSALLLLCVCQSALAESEKKPLCEQYSGYFVSNKFEPDAKESFVVISSQSQFDQVFGVAMVMRDKSHRLPKDAFKSNIVLTVIKRGKASWEYKVKGVTIEKGVVKVSYAATSKATPETEFACPLIISVPKGEYKSVVFVENGKEVKTVEGPAAPK
jgi:hypothetical protein